MGIFKKPSWVLKQKNAYSLDMMKGRRAGSVWNVKLIKFHFQGMLSLVRFLPIMRKDDVDPGLVESLPISSNSRPADDNEPSCFDEAHGKKDWEQAMDEEMNGLIKNETWDLVPKPQHVVPVTCKWVHKIKRKANGSIDRFKARLVVRVSSQNMGKTMKKLSVRLKKIGREIYMVQPPDYVLQKHPEFVCKLKKALYGLKKLQELGTKNGKLHMIVLLYVDDMIVSGNDEKEIAKLRSELSIQFEMKELGELSHFLDLEMLTLVVILDDRKSTSGYVFFCAAKQLFILVCR
ncbi:hypothetical protein Prudu_018768 [Prunus dulcis]|uniref:Reverse transcriptase Ty1/copia-type domain-containing protein n=1 Tax=Prunus dulcis TaxID=3755 RepID=A0A4Y1RRN7_PRUDU|nr:hypothetical protein Prudu_018768 [Prunus dulcis]